MKLVSVMKNVQHAQSKGCLLAIHIGYTLIMVRGWWKNWQGIRLELNAPNKLHHQREGAPELGRWGMSW